MCFQAVLAYEVLCHVSVQVRYLLDIQYYIALYWKFPQLSREIKGNILSIIHFGSETNYYAKEVKMFVFANFTLKYRPSHFISSYL